MPVPRDRKERRIS